MPKAIRIHEPGDVSVLKYETIEIPSPQAGEVLVKHHAIGVNFIDTYYRSGLYAWPETPLIPGAEGAGEVVAAGAGVQQFKPGDRVAYTTQTGSYAELRLIPADRLDSDPECRAFEHKFK